MKHWLVYRNDKQEEQFYSADEIRSMPEYPNAVFVWKEGMKEWAAPEALDEFKDKNTYTANAAAKGKKSLPDTPTQAFYKMKRKYITTIIVLVFAVLGLATALTWHIEKTDLTHTSHEMKTDSVKQSEEMKNLNQPTVSEPFEFKGIVLGSDMASIESNPRFECDNNQKPTESSGNRFCDQICGDRRHDETIAGVQIDYMHLYAYNGKLHTIRIFFNSAYFDVVSLALTKKYGDGNFKSEVIHNRMGATFENKIITWRRAGATLVATRYDDDINTSLVEFQTDFAAEEMKRRSELFIKKKANDM